MTKKEMAQDFLKLAAKGQSRKAFELYVADNFIHHNAYFKRDGHTLMRAMEENDQKNPNNIFEIQRALEDGTWLLFILVSDKHIQTMTWL